MRHILTVFGLAVLLSIAASMVGNSSSGFGTGANSWQRSSFGWPLEVWSRKEHVYQTVTIFNGERQVETVRYPTKYSINWLNASMILGSAIVICYSLTLCVFPSNAR